MDSLDPDEIVTLSFRDLERPEKPLNAVFEGRLRTALLIVRMSDPEMRARAVISADWLPDGNVPPPPLDEIARRAGLPF